MAPSGGSVTEGNRMDLDTAEVLWTLGLLRDKDLPPIACDMLLAGLDNEPLRRLAGLSDYEMNEAKPLFSAALEQLDRTDLGKEEAVRKFTRIVSRQIVSGEVDAYVGAGKIWTAQVNSDLSVGDFPDLHPFIYAASEYEDRPADREFFKQAIITAANRWLVRDTGDGSNGAEGEIPPPDPKKIIPS